MDFKLSIFIGVGLIILMGALYFFKPLSKEEMTSMIPQQEIVVNEQPLLDLNTLDQSQRDLRMKELRIKFEEGLTDEDATKEYLEEEIIAVREFMKSIE